MWLAVELWDADTWHDLAAQQVQVARDTGALTVLPVALHTLAAWHVFAGDLRLAETQLDEADSIMEATGDAPMSHARVMLMALRDGDAQTLIDASISDATARGEGVLVRHAEHAAAWLYNGLGRYDDALRWARQEHEHSPHAFYMTALPELVEAAVRCDEPEAARSALDALSAKTQAAGTAWARGIETRSRALVSEGDAAEQLYREAIAQLDEQPPGHRARACPAPLRRVAEPRAPPARGARAAARRIRQLHGDGRRTVRRARRARAAAPSARLCAGARPRPASSSPPTRLRSHGSPVQGLPMRRSAASCS